VSLDPRSWDFWVLIGFIGQFLFAGRFIVQWIVSERKRESHVPVQFWYLSVIGGSITLAYAIHRRDPVFILSGGAGIFVYSRNLYLIWHKQHQPPAG